jgi:heme-degrading monooxygenase HmoA
MFAVLFEVQPRTDQWDAYLGNAKLLRPELEQVEGFVDNIRYRSLTRDGWILSLSSWRDEKAVVRWRTRMRHHDVQAKGRAEILRDYHLRVGELTADTRVPEGHVLRAQRLDETEIGEGAAVTLLDGRRPPDWIKSASADDVARWLGLVPHAVGLVSWDVYEAVLVPGDIIAMATWRSQPDAETFARSLRLNDGVRLRRIRVVRDYGMFDRREAPQYFPDAKR